MRTNRCRPAASLPTALLIALLAAGCGSDGDSMTTPSDDSGSVGSGTATFSVTLSGAESFVSAGTLAWSGGSAAVNGWEVRLLSADNADPMERLEIGGDGDRPGPGTYAIISVNGQAGPDEFYGRVTTVSGATYYATGGALTIDTSSDETVDGNFAFSAESPTGEAVNASGHFVSDDLLDE